MATATAAKPIWGTGRRKTAVARVRLLEGGGKIMVNGKPAEDFFHNDVQMLSEIYAPLKATETLNQLDIFVRCDGGGPNGQAGACVLGIARALKKYNPEFDTALRAGGYLTRDSRMKERKKYGQKGARKQFQFSKR